ncbi:hypothetical protein [Rhizobium oryzicola]|uniref:Uncharacterized protein n=1 Tax=Rhizobium oryzicola TaxID=1232668 RepID=A0ABT8T0G5_9HYPH|nr:hypothetical protein [Rhizobium oryzicola]MDO1584207.1 hypothetical protein [Rhizobium oryzicola]
MDAAYTVSELSASQVDRAFPLASAADLAGNIDDWRLFCLDRLGQVDTAEEGEQVLVCLNPLGYLKGLYVIRTRKTHDGTVLEVPLHVVASVVDEEGVRMAFQQKLDLMAADKGCPRVEFGG